MIKRKNKEKHVIVGFVYQIAAIHLICLLALAFMPNSDLQVLGTDPIRKVESETLVRNLMAFSLIVGMFVIWFPMIRVYLRLIPQTTEVIKDLSQIMRWSVVGLVLATAVNISIYFFIQPSVNST
jgi:purine-cytosine permease-like protein